MRKPQRVWITLYLFQKQYLIFVIINEKEKKNSIVFFYIKGTLHEGTKNIIIVQWIGFAMLEGNNYICMAPQCCIPKNVCTDTHSSRLSHCTRVVIWLGTSLSICCILPWHGRFRSSKRLCYKARCLWIPCKFFPI